MRRLPGFFQLDHYNISPADVTQMVFHCAPEIIRPDVILMPWWQPEVFAAWADGITTITPGVLFELVFEEKPVSVIRSGIGAPQAGDVVLALGCTACERILFAGSVGGLRPEIRIGELMMPEFSYSGDGFNRTIDPAYPGKDWFLERATPDEGLALSLARTVAPLASQAGVRVHSGPVFCIDSILAQFGKLDCLAGKLGCIGIEMETAAVFKAARMLGIRAAALFSVSDVPVRKKTLYSGRSDEEQKFRKEIRSKVLAKALLDCLKNADIP